MPLNLILDAAGTYTAEDDGIPGNNVSVVRDPTGAIVETFLHPADSLSFFCASGVNLVLDFSDTLGAADLNVGMLTDPTETPASLVVQNVQTAGRVTLASNGSITEGSDSGAAPDLLAGSLIMSAVTGIGIPAKCARDSGCGA